MDPTPPPHRTPPPAWARASASVAAGLLAWSATAAGVRGLRPPPDDYVARDKLAWLEQHGESVDLLFVGSSLVFRDVVPEVVDAELAARGFPLRSYNFGVPALRAFETDHLLRELLAIEELRPRYVLIEPRSFNPELEADNVHTLRAVSWHTPGRTADVLRHVWTRRGPSAGERWELAWTHASLGARWLSSYGQGPRVVRALFGHGARAEDALLQENAGFEPLAADGGEGREERRARLGDERDFKQKVRSLTDGNAGPAGFDPAEAPLWEAQVAWVRESGAEPLYLLPPGIRSTPRVLRLASENALPALLAFNDPERYPELYRFEERFDPNHLNAAGAERFSRLLAAELARWLEAQP